MDPASDVEPPSVADEEARWTSTVVLGDGDTALIRPMRRDDAPALDAFHRRQSAENRYLRYFSPQPALSQAQLERFTDVDFLDRAAFVVEAHGEFIAWASYERWQRRDDAEVAFQVDDRHQGLGIATLLLEHLAVVARTNGISRFTAQTLAENRAMLTVFAKAGWPVQRRFESGVVDIDFALDDTTEFLDSVERREQRADSRAVARLLLPRSIAVIGASETPGSIGATLWQRISADESRPVYPVNPRHDSVGGVPAYRSVVDIPGEIGLAVVAVPMPAVAATLDECIAKRVRGAIIVSAPLDEPGHPDAAAIRDMVEHARHNGLRIIGPASMGIASPRPDVAIQAALVAVTVPPGGVAISMQSGTLGGSLLRLAGSLQLGLSWFVSLGDKIDVSSNDLLQFWEDDATTRVICLYTESVGNGRKFARIARRVARTRPIVVVRTGAALVGAGPDAMYRQSGVIEVPTVPALLDTARVLASQPLMTGDRVTVVSNARSPAVATEATLAEAGLTVVAPPLRLDWRSTPDDYRAAIGAALGSTAIDALVIVHAPPTEQAVDLPTAAIAAATAGAAKPVVAVMLGLLDGPLAPGSAVPSFAFPEQAAAALARVHWYSAWRDAELAAPEDSRPAGLDRPAASRLIDELLVDGTGDQVAPQAAGELLAAYGVTMPPSMLVAAEDAPQVAESIGFPVAVKARTRGLGRSREAGVALDLSDAEDVRDAVATMRRHLAGGAEQVLVQQMVAPGTDLRVRVRRDPIGPIVTVGLGGFQADVIGDEASRVAPVSPSTARAMIADTRAAATVRTEDDLDALVGVIVRVAQLASDHPEIVDFDLNPVLVRGGEGTVVDATLRLEESHRPERAVRRLEAD